MADFFARKRQQLVYLFVCLLLVLTVAVFFLAANLQLLEEKTVFAQDTLPGAAELVYPDDVSLQVMARLVWLIRAGIVALMALGAVTLGNILEVIVKVKDLERGGYLSLNYRQARRPYRSC